MSNGIVPSIKTIENGREMPNARVDPAVAGFIAQMAMASQLVKIRKLEESKIPTGLKSFSVSVDGTRKKIGLNKPWISISMINDGLNSVYTRLNSLEGPLIENGAVIKSGEPYTYDADYPIITCIYLQCASGESATVRIHGEEGQWA